MAENQYPKRPPFFANRVIRLLQKSCAANEIGIEACWLVTCIAQVEDSKHYTGPVTFWSAQLMPITGFQSWGRLDRARQRAVETGWLYYRPGTNRQCGVYWCLIPEAIQRAFNDSPVDEVNHQNGDSSEVNHQNGAHDGDRNVVHAVIETLLKRSACGEPSIPVPVPVPKQVAALPTMSSKSNPEDEATARWMFDIVLQLQPEHKRPNFAAWAKDIRLMRERDGRTDVKIRALFTAVDDHVFWQKNVRSPATLRGKWDRLELDCLLNASSNISADFEAVRATIKRVWSPDIKNHRDVEAAINNADLFRAAKITGLSVIADCQDGDRKVQSAFAGHLKSIQAGRATV